MKLGKLKKVITVVRLDNMAKYVYCNYFYISVDIDNYHGTDLIHIISPSLKGSVVALNSLRIPHKQIHNMKKGLDCKLKCNFNE